MFGRYFFELIRGRRPSCDKGWGGFAFPRPVVGVRRGSTPNIDGVVDSSEWNDATSLLTGEPPSIARL